MSARSPHGARAGRARARLGGAAAAVILAAAPLRAARAAQPPTVRRDGAIVVGRVLDAATGAPIAGATVTLAGGAADAPRADSLALRTDARGAWRAAAMPAARLRLHVRALGYAPATVTLDATVGGVVERTVRLDAAALPLDQVVVTGARRAQRLADAVVTTEVVTRADLARTGASDLGAVLVEQTGIELQGGHPSGTGVMLQGIGAERVLVLVDGQPLAGRLSGVLDVARLPTAAIERVEVVRGPQSTLYGSDAMGGVINVVTRTPPAAPAGRGAMGVAAQLTAGNQARRDGALRVTLARGPIAASMDAGRRHAETTPGRASVDGALADRADLAAKLRWAAAGGGALRSLEASVLGLDERQRWREGTLFRFADNRSWTARLSGVAASDGGATARHRLTPTLSLSSFDHRARGSAADRPIAGDSGQRQRQRTLQAEVLYNGRLGRTAAHALDVGVQLRRDETQAERVAGGLRQLTTVEPFAQLELTAAPGLALLPGVRVTHSALWGTRVTPRVALRQRLGAGVTLRASAGAGFRAPDFKELYMRFVNTSAGYAVNGNPDLRPESSRNVTGGVEWAGARGFLRTQLYRNALRGFIETRAVTAPGEPAVYVYANVDDGMTRGADVEGGATLGRLRLEGSVSALATRDHATGRPLLGRPAHSGRVTLSGPLPFGLRASATTLHTGRTAMTRDGASGAVTGWRDAFLRTDVRLTRRLGPAGRGPELVLGADNLLDRQPAQWAGFTGRHVYTALSWAHTPFDAR